jgi:hypothetical protein
VLSRPVRGNALHGVLVRCARLPRLGGDRTPRACASIEREDKEVSVNAAAA